MYSTHPILDAISENNQLTEQWLEVALLLEEAGDLEGALFIIDKLFEFYADYCEKMQQNATSV